MRSEASVYNAPMDDISTIGSVTANGIEAVFTDIDGTLTDAEGRLSSAVFAAMEQARAAGLAVVPVTGRPAGWCDLIARTWPVNGVIGENGGLYFRAGAHGQGMERLWAQDDATRSDTRARLKELGDRILACHPGAALASDQAYREFDLAIDFCEDVTPLPDAEIDAICQQLSTAGCTVKVSNIHINAWFGHFDKATMCLRVGLDRFDWALDGGDNHKVAFFGDSPNDSPLFSLFRNGIGVANVRKMAARMPALPKWCTRAEGGAGFIEGIEAILKARISSTAGLPETP